VRPELPSRLEPTGSPGRAIQRRHDGSPVIAAEGLSGAVAAALSGIADEASEASTEHYDGDAEVDGDRLRIWFGLVEPGIAGADWRGRLPELPAIALAEILT
jgi:hypothetical protein